MCDRKESGWCYDDDKFTAANEDPAMHGKW